MYEKDKKLIRQAQQGDKEALTKLLEQNRGLIWSVVKRYLGKGYEAEDIYQIACIGFIESVQRFKFEFGGELSTYSVPYMLGEIKKFFRDDGMIKISRSIKELGVTVKVESIHDAIGKSGKEKMELIDANEDEQNKLVDKIAIKEMIDKLNQREKMLIRLRFYKDKTQMQVANILGISQVHVSRIEKKILSDFKRKLVV